MAEIKIPNHVGIIMDGNGRWAKLRNRPRTFGHKKGSDNVDRITTEAFKRGVKTLTLYAFSTENWSRPKEEVDALMGLLEKYFLKFIGKAVKKNVRVCVIGDKKVFSPKLQKVIKDCEDASKKNTGNVLNIAINYGGRQEIVRAVNNLIKKGKKITVESISENLYTTKNGEPDLIIRTGGEYRLSNFLMYQGAYSELYFTDVLWPDFDEKELDKALDEYAKRNRRFGGVK
ncbi:MAG: isoprenyl transferase [Clostridia bacterium]|nr:isoprenyl transferase [Clostridia bacterium]